MKQFFTARIDGRKMIGTIKISEDVCHLLYIYNDHYWRVCLFHWEVRYAANNESRQLAQSPSGGIDVVRISHLKFINNLYETIQ